MGTLDPLGKYRLEGFAFSNPCVVPNAFRFEEPLKLTELLLTELHPCNGARGPRVAKSDESYPCRDLKRSSRAGGPVI